MASGAESFARRRARWISILRTLSARADQDDVDLTGYSLRAANVAGTPSRVTLSPSDRSFTITALDDLKGCFTGAPIDLDLPCTATEQGMCQIVPRLSVWNELLSHARLQLRQLSGAHGQLSLVTPKTRCWPIPTKEEWIQASALVYWLLHTHTCVAFVDISDFGGHDQFICEALCANSTVKKLKFHSGIFKNRLSLFKLFCCMKRVEELECMALWACVDDCLVGALGSLIRSTMSLTSLKLSTLCMGEEMAFELLENLRANSTIKELSLHASVAHCSAFRDYLHHAVNLTSLSVSTHLEPRKWTLKPILTGLLENETITEVTLRDFIVEWESAELVFKVLAQNRVLRAFHVTISRCTPFLEPGNNYTLWVAALCESRALREVTLPMDILRPQQWKTVTKVLSTNASIRKLTLQVDDILQHSPVTQVCQAIRESGAERKVSLGTVITDDIDVLSCKASMEPWICRSRFLPGSDHLLTLMRSLPSFDHITSLSLQLNTSDFDGELLLDITDYISSTGTLQKLRLQTYGEGTSDFWNVIVQSVSRNASIRNLELSAPTFGQENAQMVADVVNASRTISTLNFNALSPWEMGAFLRRLSEAVRDNYTLLDISLRGEVSKDSAPSWFTVLDTARRNSGLVALGAEFVVGSRQDRYGAQALELVFSHPALIEEIMKLSSATEAEASAMVRKSLGDISSMLAFVQLAGIVHRRLQCHDREDGRLQLHDLNDDCLRQLRSYLKISHVRHSA